MGKSKIGKGPGYKDLRAIYAFDLKTKTLAESPYLMINIQEIEVKAKELGMEFPRKEKKGKETKELSIKFRPSELAIHPKTREIYILSAIDRLLVIIDTKGAIKHLMPLNATLFNKPEGLTFLSNGDMFISNEAEGVKPTLLRFTYNL